jgi:hypothetical protein
LIKWQIMLAEIEKAVMEMLKENLKPVHVRVNSEKKDFEDKQVILTNIKFKFKKSDFSDDQQEPVREEFSGDSKKRAFVLASPPFRRSLTVEYPIHSVLSEKKDFTIDYDKPSPTLTFVKAPEEGENNILVKYQSSLTLKTIGFKALYSIDVIAKNRSQADELSEEVVKTILTNEDILLKAGIETTAVGGSIQDNTDGHTIVRLRYIFGQDLRTQKAVKAMGKIGISLEKQS